MNELKLDHNVVDINQIRRLTYKRRTRGQTGPIPDPASQHRVIWTHLCYQTNRKS